MFEGRGCLLCALPLLASSPGQSILEFTEIAHVAVQDLAGLHPIHVGSSGWIVFFGWVGSSTDCCCEAFAAGIQRQVPHWTSKGKDDSWEDWVWSYGNGCQTQLNPNCGKEICLAIDIAAIDISQLPFWSQVVLEPWQRVLPADPTRTPPWHPWLLVSKPWLRWNAVASMPCRGRSLSTVSCSCSLFPSFLKIATKQKSRAVDLRATGTQERQPFSTLKAAVQVLLQMHRTRVFCQTFHSRLRAVKKKIHTKYDLFPACLLPELGHHLSWFQKKTCWNSFWWQVLQQPAHGPVSPIQWLDCSLFTVHCLLFVVHCSLFVGLVWLHSCVSFFTFYVYIYIYIFIYMYENIFVYAHIASIDKRKA